MNIAKIAFQKYFIVFAVVVAALLASASVCSVAAGVQANPGGNRHNDKPLRVSSPVEGPNYNFNSDAVLVHFLMIENPLFSRTLAGCTHLEVKRYKLNGRDDFNISGFCYIKNNPQEDLDCGGYDINATGSIDNSVQATVRKIGLTLVCSG